MRLWFVIPARNAVDTIGQQLDALMPQVDEQDFVVVVDNGSTDDTMRVVAEREGRKVRRDYESQVGRHHACNRGAAHARDDEALVFIDADDEVQPGFVDAMREALADHPFVSAHLAPWGDEIGVGGLPEVGGRRFVSGGAMGVHADVFRAVGGWGSVPYAEDVDLSWRLMDAGCEPYYEPKATIRYRPRTSARGIFRQHRNYGRGQAVLARKWPIGRVSTRREWISLVTDLPSLLDRRKREAWAARAGRLTGRLF